MSTEWNINYARWIIDDGEPEREVGDCFRWSALEFWAQDRLTKSATPSQSASPRADFTYHVVAEVVHISGDAAVIDFGLRAVGRTELLPKDCGLGEYITGDIGLGFPLCTPVLPESIIMPMDHGWEVKQILADLTPYRPGDETGSWLVRDAQRVAASSNSRARNWGAAYQEVQSTRNRIADSYVLLCAQKD